MLDRQAVLDEINERLHQRFYDSKEMRNLEDDVRSIYEIMDDGANPPIDDAIEYYYSEDS